MKIFLRNGFPIIVAGIVGFVDGLGMGIVVGVLLIIYLKLCDK